MKRPDLNNLILPGFLQLVELPSGAQRVALQDTLRVAQVATLLKCDPATVRGMCEDGTLTAYRLTDRDRSCYVIQRASVDAYLKKRGLTLATAGAK
jgi:excisionase family DNA binding protein